MDTTKQIPTEELDRLALEVARKQGWAFPNGLELSEGSLASACAQAGYEYALRAATPSVGGSWPMAPISELPRHLQEETLYVLVEGKVGRGIYATDLEDEEGNAISAWAAWDGGEYEKMDPQPTHFFYPPTATPSLPVQAGPIDKNSLVPTSAQYWYNASLKSEKLEDREFCAREAYKHIVGALYAANEKQSTSSPSLLVESKQERWIRVEDRLPEPNTQVWVCFLHYGKRQDVRTAFFRPDGIWDEFLGDSITHWQPLYVQKPTAPQQKGGEAL